VFSELGSSVEGGGSSAYSKLDKLAKDRVAKSGGDVTYAKSYEQVLSENPDLYTQSLNEKGA
jgi:hypothetical protein